jgi:hypothetical protein
MTMGDLLDACQSKEALHAALQLLGRTSVVKHDSIVFPAKHGGWSIDFRAGRWLFIDSVGPTPIEGRPGPCKRLRSIEL